jgi:hypothetical protein
MKKLPLVFCLLFFACSARKEVVSNTTVFNKHQQPYHVFSIGKWDRDQMIYTLTDARNSYFIVKGDYNASIKRGDVYNP